MSPAEHERKMINGHKKLTQKLSQTLMKSHQHVCNGFSWIHIWVQASGRSACNPWRTFWWPTWSSLICLILVMIIQKINKLTVIGLTCTWWNMNWTTQSYWMVSRCVTDTLRIAYPGFLQDFKFGGGSTRRVLVYTLWCWSHFAKIWGGWRWEGYPKYHWSLDWGGLDWTGLDSWKRQK